MSKGYVCSVKDCFNFAGQTTDFGLRDSTLKYDCATDSTVVKLLRSSMYDVIRTTGTSFCTGTLSDVGIHKNGLRPGASSNGSALDVDYDRADVSVCTDTFGSCVFPASRINCFGFKPSYGRISRYGVAPLCSFLDTVSVMSKSFTHVQKVFETLDVYDVKDANCTPSARRLDDSTIRLKVPYDYFSKADLDYIRSVHKDVELVDLKVSVTDLAQMLKGFYWYLMTPDFYSNIARFDGFHHKNRPDVISEYNVSKIVEDRTTHINSEQKSRLILGRALCVESLAYVYESTIISFLERTFDEDSTWILPVALNLRSNNEDQICNVSTVANLLKRPLITVPSATENGLTYMSKKNSDKTLLRYIKTCAKSD